MCGLNEQRGVWDMYERMGIEAGRVQEAYGNGAPRTAESWYMEGWPQTRITRLAGAMPGLSSRRRIFPGKPAGRRELVNI
jgi:hypothetical protein